MSGNLIHLKTAALLAATLAIGCDRQAPSPPPATMAATVPATAPATSQASISLINVNNHSTVFPPARMRIERDNDHLIATLFSDDPREALKDNYTGNSYYLRMELDVDDVANLSQAQWHFQLPSSDKHEDSPYGIFLAGRQTQIQPYDVRAVFRRAAGSETVTVLLSGQFQIVSATSDGGPTQMLPVAAELSAHLDKVPASN